MYAMIPIATCSFKCDYSSVVWKVMSSKMKVLNINDDWRNIVDRLSDMPCNSNIRSVVRKMVVATCVYGIWKERNARIFTTDKKSTKVIIKEIEDSVKLLLLSLQVKNSIQLRAVEEE